MDYAERHYPAPSPSDTFTFAARTAYWSVLAARPDAGSDVDLYVYGDAARTQLLGTSHERAGPRTSWRSTPTSGTCRPTAPEVTAGSRTSGYTVVAAQGANTLTGATTTVTLGNQPVRVWDVAQQAGQAVTSAWCRAPARTSG